MNQDQAFDILTLGHNVFLTGAAGSGKTFLINRFVRYCHEHAISIAITASTGIAATHIGGMTVHSWSGIGIRDTLSDDEIDDIISREYISKRFAKTHVLIIDEVSMLSGNFLANLDRLLRSARVSPYPFGGMQIVLVGDFFQLPPVSRGSDMAEFAFEHPAWRTFSLAMCLLTTQFRQKSENNTIDPLLDILDEIRAGTISQKSHTALESRNIAVNTEDHTELFTKNIAVDAYNTSRLNAIHSDTFVFEMQAKGAEKLIESLKKGCLAPETLVLKVGARVMFVKNNFEAGYVNGSIGHIVGKHEGFPIVELLSGEKVIADFADWSIEENGRVKASIMQIPLRLAWAITVHKSQGMTLESAVMDLSDCFVAGQGYVALSRVRSLAGLTLRGYNSTALMIDPRVRQYDQVLQATSLATVERLSGISLQEKKEKQHQAIKKLGGVIDPISPELIKKKSQKIATHLETYELIQSGKGLDEIADIRNLKFSTIWSHVEKLVEEGKNIELSRYRPQDENRLQKIHLGFITLSTLNLSPVREYLIDTHDEDFDYDEIRIARIFLSQKDRKKIEENMLYETEGI